jgi:hypothetical protein
MKRSRIRSRALLTVISASFALCAAASSDPAREWRFAVSLDGKPIGEHRFTKRESEGRVEVTSEANFHVRFLFIDAYHYEHRVHEIWRGDCLERLDARTDDNGDEVVISGERAGRGFSVTTDGVSAGMDPCVQTFAYWNPRILEATHLLNPQTGEYVPVQMQALGPDAAGEYQGAQHYRLSGGAGTRRLHIDLWYTDAHDWLALESLTPDGRRLRYSKMLP